MAAKKKTKPKARPKKKTVKPRELTKTEAFYVESHLGKKTAAELADEIDVPENSIEAHIQVMKKNGWTPESGPQKAFFAVKNGTVSMTAASSAKGDAINAEKRRNEEFFRQRAPGVHVINPDLPVQ